MHTVRVLEHWVKALDDERADALLAIKTLKGRSNGASDGHVNDAPANRESVSPVAAKPKGPRKETPKPQRSRKTTSELAATIRRSLRGTKLAMSGLVEMVGEKAPVIKRTIDKMREAGEVRMVGEKRNAVYELAGAVENEDDAIEGTD